MDKNNSSPVKLKRAKRGPGRPPKPKPQTESYACSSPNQEKEMNSTYSSQLTESEFRMPPLPSALAAGTSGHSTDKVASEINSGSTSTNELFIDGFSIYTFATEEEVKEALLQTGKAYESKKPNFETPVKLPRLPKRDSRSPTELQLQRTPKSSGRGRGRRSKKSRPVSKLAREGAGEDWEDMDTDTESSQSSHATSDTSNSVQVKPDLVPKSEVEASVKREELQAFPEQKHSDLLRSSRANCELNPSDTKDKTNCLPLLQLGKPESTAESAPPSKSTSAACTSIKTEADIKSSYNSAIEPISPPGYPLPANHSKNFLQDSRLKNFSIGSAGSSSSPGSSPAEKHHKSGSRSSSNKKGSSSHTDFSIENSDHSCTAISRKEPQPPTYSTTTTASSLTTSTSSTITITASPKVTPATTTVTTSNISQPRSSSVLSTSSGSRQATPYGSSNTASREQESHSAGLASRNSERIPSRNSQPHQSSSATSSQTADPFSLLLNNSVYNPLLNSNMLSSFMGPNGMGAPFSQPGQPAGYAAAASGVHPGFGFGPTPFHTAASQPSLGPNQIDALRLELSRKMFESTNDRNFSQAPFLRPEMLFQSPSATNAFPPALQNSLLQQMFLMNQRSAPAGRMPPVNQIPPTTTAVTAISSNNPGSSPFQTIPGSNTNPISSSEPQKKSGKWCSAHIKIAWFIHSKENQLKTGSQKKEKQMSSSLECSPATGKLNSGSNNMISNHSISAITATNIHKPKDVPARAAHPASISSPHTNSSTIIGGNNSLGKPSHSFPAIDKHQPTPVNKSNPTNSMSPFSNLSSMSKDASHRPNSKDSRWSRTELPHSHLSSSSPASTTSWINKRDEHDFRRCNGTDKTSSPNPSSGSRSSSADNRHRSRSRSPHTSHRSPQTMANKYDNLSSSLPSDRARETLKTARPDIFTTSQSLLSTQTSSVPSQSSHCSDLAPQHQALLNSLYPNFSNSANGMMAAPPLPPMWGNLGSNPSNMSSEAERFLQLQLFSMQKSIMDSVRNTGGTVNGLHPSNHNSLSHLSSIGSVPPPLIQTTQHKLTQNIPSIATASQSRLATNSANNDASMNCASGTNSLFPRS